MNEQEKAKWVERIAWEDSLRDVTKALETLPNNLQNIHTPFGLCHQMITRLETFTSLRDKKILCLNLEFIEVLIRDFGIIKENIWFATDCEQKAQILKHPRYLGVNVVVGDFLKWSPNMKFDLVIMNPPYQAGTNNKGTGHTLWDKFVLQANNVISVTGGIAAIHPSLWRKPGHKVFYEITKNGMPYLEIHDEKDGMKTFGAETRYDWYVTMRLYDGKTTIVDQNGVKNHVDIKRLPFIPNSEFGFISKLLASKDDSKIEILHSESAYEPRKKWMSDVQTSEFQYPCVYTIGKDCKPSLKWSNTKANGHFGIPKVIWSTGRPISVGFMADKKGEYGLTQWASAIVDSTKNLDLIAKAMSSDKFRNLCSSMSMSKLEVNTKVISLFKKDFWKYFVDEQGNEI